MPVDASGEPADDSCSGIVPQPPVPLDYDNPKYEQGMYDGHWDETYGAIGFHGRRGESVEVPGSKFVDADGEVMGVRHYNEGGGRHTWAPAYVTCRPSVRL
eukprot:jgi/Ulvmu1/2113/UM126_0006.1